MIGFARYALVASMLGAPPAAAQDALPEDTRSAEDIYTRVLENRLDASVQELQLVSAGPGGDAQPIQVYVWHREYPEGKSADGDIRSKSLVRYLAPRDYRGIGYLILRRSQGPSDQFMYAPSRRKVRRFNLSEEEIAGTDFALEDILPRVLEEAEYHREADALVDGEPCFVIEARLRPEVQSQYSRFLLYVEKQHYVPLRTRYWDNQQVEVKELTAATGSIAQVAGVWLARERAARNLQEGTETRLRIERIAADTELSERVFSQRWLSSKRPPPAPWSEDSGD